MKQTKKAKTANSSTSRIELTIPGSWLQGLEEASFFHHPAKEDWRKRLIHTMYTWAEDPRTLEILEFCCKYKIPYRTLKKYVDKYDDVREAYNDVKLTLACHRRVGTMWKDLDGKYAYKDMHVYDPEWVAVDKYNAEMLKTEDVKGNVTVVMQAAPTTKEVPEKK